MARKGPLALTLVALLGGGISACAGKRPADSGPEAADRPTIAEAPAAVQATFGRYAPTGVPAGTVEQETEDDLATWSAEYPGESGIVEVSALADGTLVSVEREVAAADAPAVVRERAAALLGAAATTVDHLRLAVYELEERTASGRVRERFVDPYGRVVLERVLEPGADTETPVPLTDLPAAVRATMTTAAGGAGLSDVHRETMDGHPVFAASWHAADGAHEVAVLEDGTMLSVELATGPVAARVAALTEKGEGETGEAARGDEEGDAGEETATAEANETGTGVERMLLEVWEAKATVGDTVRQVLLLPTGQILGNVTSGPDAPGDAD